MFKKCNLMVVQRMPSANPRWVQVELTEVQTGSTGKGSAMYEWIFAFGQGYQFSGIWTLGVNSQTSRGDEAYTIGLGNHTDKFWRYSANRRELEFVQRENLTGGPSYGSTTKNVRIAAILQNAVLSRIGIAPAGTATSAVCRVFVGSNILRAGQPASWEPAYTTLNKR